MPRQKLNEKRYRFSMRKLAVGLVSTAIGSFFLMSTATANQLPVTQQGTINYQYVTEAELNEEEKQLIIHELPTIAKETDANYFLVYRPKKEISVLPKTGENSLTSTLLAVSGVSLLIVAVKVGKKGRRYLSGLFLISALGTQVLATPVSALTSSILRAYNQEIEVQAGQQLPQPLEIDGYEYVGYFTQ
ncbi:YSIRK-type signal peptide-containing protein, partial [Streptococcus oralis]|uniref:YSIRK-type signal peptide-containing protein n=1 Tax=Streptococcus oralis TaxID=1303 RepID=UPI0012DA2F81